MIWTELVCDWCRDVYTNGATIRELRKNARASGWAFAWSEDHRCKIDICPECIKSATKLTNAHTPTATEREGE